MSQSPGGRQPRFTGAHLLLLVSVAAAFVVLRAAGSIGIVRTVSFLALAYVSIVPMGWLLVRLLVPDLLSNSVRWALILTLGYAVSVMVGFFLGVGGLGSAYLPVCIASLALMLVWWTARIRHEGGGVGAAIPLLSQTRVWPSEPACVVGALVALGILATAPLMAPVHQVSPSQYIDYSFIDVYFMTARAQVFTRGAPPYTLVDLAGAMPYVYPDFHLFWLGQMASWSRIDVNAVYFVYAPIVLILMYTLTMYAIGKQLSGSRWGGYIAGSLPYVVLLSDFHDIDPFRMNPSLMHFMDLRTALSHGMAGMLITAIALSVYLSLRNSYGRRTVLGLLMVAGVLTVFLVRLRPHFFFAVAPWYGLFVLFQAWRRRDIAVAAPVLVVGALFAAVYFESTGSHYNPGSTRLALAYGLFSTELMKYDQIPGLVRAALGALPGIVRPLAASAAFSVVRILGTAFTVLLLGYAILVLGRKARPSAAEAGLVLAWLTALVLSTIVILDERREVGGDWGFQALIIAGPVALILAIAPIYHALRALASYAPSLNAERNMLAVGVLALATTVTYRGADSVLRSQLQRAYPITAAEMNGYHWIMANTPETAVVAAHPEHQVNAGGETVATTSFLAGQSRRPAYLQRVAAYFSAEGDRRRQILAGIFDSETVDGVKSALQEATFDYLLVYPDKPPRVDLSCCLTPVYEGHSADGKMSIYRLEK